MSLKILKCWVENCPTPDIIISKTVPPIDIARIMTNVQVFTNSEMKNFLINNKSKLEIDSIDFDIEDFKNHISKQIILNKKNENAREEYIVVYCECGHKNIILVENE